MIGSGRRLFTNHLPDILKALTHWQSIYLSIYLSALIYSIYLSINIFTYLSNFRSSFLQSTNLSIYIKMELYLSIKLVSIHYPFLPFPRQLSCVNLASKEMMINRSIPPPKRQLLIIYLKITCFTFCSSYSWPN